MFSVVAAGMMMIMPPQTQLPAPLPFFSGGVCADGIVPFGKTSLNIMPLLQENVLPMAYCSR